MLFSSIKLINFTVVIFCLFYTLLSICQVATKKPEINFYGTLIDTTGHSYQVENITIGGRYKDIIVYQKPINSSVNPDINKTKLNLSEIANIKTIVNNSLQSDGSLKRVVTFDRRDYIEIEVQLHGKLSQYTYIIERYKKIFCDQRADGSLLEKEISFEGLNELRIVGYKEKDSQHISCESMLTQTKMILNSIEQAAERLPDAEERTIKDQILDLINELKMKIKNWFT